MNSSTNQTDPAKLEHEKGLQERAQKLEDVAFQKAVLNEALARMRAFSKGVQAYHTHPRTQRPDAPLVLAEMGAARLLDYGSLNNGSGGTPVLIIPSLINRAYILDLSEQRSLTRYMASRGLRPLLIDWGMPGEAEADYNLDSYITGPLQYFFDVCNQLDNRPTTLVGYCMGGLLALALAQRNLAKTNALALLATPWNFHAGNQGSLAYLKSLKPGIDVLLDQFGKLPVDILQAMFANLSPSLTADKFQSFAKLNISSSRARSFVELEDWLNDGVPLVSGAARDCLFDWYLENSPCKGQWRVAGNAVLPEQITRPSLTLIPKNDHIVPPGSAQALAALLPQNETRLINAGHIGMVAGRYAKSTLYEPLVEWIQLHTE